MPFANFKSIREVSSEDINFAAENLLKQTGKKWKTKTCGERVAFVVIELSEPYKITGIDIGNEHSAFIEVLVSNTSCSSSDFTEILVTCSFMTLIESKNSTNINRVRCFGKDALISTALSKKWKFIKIICSQPFNKYVQYGISFIKIHVDADIGISKTQEASEKSISDVKKSSSLNISQLGKFKLREESPDSDSECAASLFKRWKASEMDSTITQNSDRTITKKETTSQDLILKNKSENLQKNSTSEKLTLKTVKRLSSNDDFIISPDRNRQELGFGKEETIDERICKKRQRLSEAIELEREELRKKSDKSIICKDSQKDLKRALKMNEKKKITNCEEDKIMNSNDGNNKEQKNNELKMRTYRPFNELLKGTVLVISGIQNPERSTLRDKALSMGAKYRSDWGNGCTHLICAFKNTPKYNQVRGNGKIVTRAWIEDCHGQKKYLPWRRYALDSSELTQPESEEEVLDESFRPASTSCDLNISKKPIANIEVEMSTVSSGSDTDDDIQRVLERNTNKNNAKEGSVLHDNSVFDVSTEEEVYLSPKIKLDGNIKSGCLLKGLVFFICSDIRSTERKRIENLIKLNQGSIARSEREGDLFISTGEAIESISKKNGKFIKPDWIYESIDMEMRVPIENYLL